MVSEEKLAAFLKLQQLALDIEESTKLLEQFLPIVFQELNLVGYSYIFLSAIFLEQNGKIKQTFFTDQSKSQAADVTNMGNLFKKGSEWEMKVMYGEAAVVSDVNFFINPSYPEISKIKSLLLLPIQHARKLYGILILASGNSVDKITAEEIEFGEMITRLINLSYRLEDTTKEVYQSDKLKDDFVSIASHELRTPMTAIRSYAWMALNKSDVPLSDKLERYLVRVLISTERSINLVNDMLNISRIESGKIGISPEPVDLIPLVKDIIDEVYYSKSTEKKFEFVVLEKPIPKVFADPDKLRQVLLNLVGNSIKFTPMEGKIIFDFFSDGKTVEIIVKDTGIGVSADDLGKLFHKFSRLDNSYTAVSTSGGTGLGLYISKNLAELMHGRIWATSEGLGKGTTMTVSLPAATPDVLSHAQDYTLEPNGEVKGLEPVAI